MRVLICDCGRIDDTLPIALKYNVGIDVQEFTNPDNIDNNAYLSEYIAGKIEPIKLRGFHGPFSELTPATRDKKIRDVVLTRFQTAYQFALKVGASHFNLHTGFIPKTYPHEIWIKNSVEFWCGFLADKNDGIAVHIENVYEENFSLIEELLNKINERLGREAVSACVDIGHVNSNSSKSIKEWIEGLNNKIKYVHIHNNNGILDDHWGLWKGKINIPEVLDLLMKHSPDSLWMIESLFPDLEQSVIWMNENGYLK